MYSYINENAIEKKINYSYSNFQGKPFLNEWKNVRQQFQKIVSGGFDFHEELIKVKALLSQPTEQMLHEWCNSINNGELDTNKLNLLVKRFEVTKKIYGEYDQQLRPVDKTNFMKIVPYILFSTVLVLSYETSKKLQYLNTLLKVNDILCSVYGLMEEYQRNFLAWLIGKEIIFVEDLYNKLNK